MHLLMYYTQKTKTTTKNKRKQKNFTILSMHLSTNTIPILSFYL